MDPEKLEVKWDTERHFSWGLDDITESLNMRILEMRILKTGILEMSVLVMWIMELRILKMRILESMILDTVVLGMRRMNNGAENYLQFDRI